MVHLVLVMPLALGYYWHATDQTKITTCDEIAGLTISSTPETTGVTSFVSEAAICAVAPIEDAHVSFVSGTPELQDLKEYFRRPRLISSSGVTTTRSTLEGITVTRDLIFNTWFPGGLIRLEGVQAVRFNMKFHLTLSSSPFHQGMLAMSFQYGYNTNGTLDQYNRGFNPAMCTNLPHVRMDMAEVTMSSLEVPYLAQYDYVSLDSSFNTVLGLFSLCQVMATPTLANSSTPQWKLYVHLEDLELIGCTTVNSQSVVPQSGLRSRSEGGGSSSQTTEAASTGVLSRIARSGATVASGVSALVPSLSSIGGPTAWFLDASAKALSAFGYSKPRDENQPARHYRTDYVGDINLDLPNEAFSLSSFARNKLRVDSTMGGTDVDEMSMEYVLGKYCQIFYGDMSTTDSAGTRLYATQVCPSHFWFRANSSRPGGNLPFPVSSSLANNAVQPSTLCYFSHMFRYWRGGFRFRITFSKTKFHGGRVIVGFVPKINESTGAAPVTNVVEAVEVSAGGAQPFSYTQIFDLRDDSVIEFDVDYLSSFLYMGVNSGIGGLTMTVVDPLISNGESATTINYLVEVCAMPGFEFSFPSAPNVAAVTGNSNIVFSQSGLGVSNSRPTAEYAPGEKFMSLKQIAMMPTYSTFDVPAAGLSTTAMPFWSYLPRITPIIPQPTNSQGFFASSRPGLVAACYAYWNGATSYHIYKDGDTTGVSSWMYYNQQDSGFTTVLNNGSSYSHSSAGGINAVYTNNGAAHYEAPTFSRYARIGWADQYAIASGNRYYAPQTLNLRGGNSTYAQPVLTVRNSTTAPKRVVFSIAAADDARCTTWLGPPPLFLTQSLQTVPMDSSSQNW